MVGLAVRVAGGDGVLGSPGLSDGSMLICRYAGGSSIFPLISVADAFAGQFLSGSELRISAKERTMPLHWV